MEIYIAKGEKEVLTRVCLQINNITYKVESPYSDSDLRELAMRCIEAYLSEINISKDIVLETITSIVKGEQVKYVKELVRPVKIKMIFEQYDKREIVEQECSFNIIESLISTLKSCAIMATWHEDSIKDCLIEYLEDNGIELNIDDEDVEDDNTSTVSIEA